MVGCRRRLRWRRRDGRGGVLGAGWSRRRRHRRGWWWGDRRGHRRSNSCADGEENRTGACSDAGGPAGEAADPPGTDQPDKSYHCDGDPTEDERPRSPAEQAKSGTRQRQHRQRWRAAAAAAFGGDRFSRPSGALSSTHSDQPVGTGGKLGGGRQSAGGAQPGGTGGQSGGGLKRLLTMRSSCLSRCPLRLVNDPTQRPNRWLAVLG